jgi:hypothetical protein
VQPTMAAALRRRHAASTRRALLSRLQAASLAQTTGIPLTKAEAEWLLGSGLNTEAVKHARCSVEKRRDQMVLETTIRLTPPWGMKSPRWFTEFNQSGSRTIAKIMQISNGHAVCA